MSGERHPNVALSVYLSAVLDKGRWDLVNGLSVSGYAWLYDVVLFDSGEE